MSTMRFIPTHFTLSNGRKMPSVGLGTGNFTSEDGPEGLKRLLLAALKEGYRHIDTGMAYGTEKAIGEAIKECGVPRDQLFITSKLDQNWHEPEAVAEALDRSLKDLQLDYVDAYLMHFPIAYKCTGPDHIKERHENGKPVIDIPLSRRYPDVWKSMEALVYHGKARSIGVSNFNILKLRRLLQNARIPPAINQVELHPYLPQRALVDFCHSHKIHVTAHQPLGGTPIDAVKGHKDIAGPLFHPPIISLAEQASHSAPITVAQLLLMWNLSRGISVVPKTTKISRLRENLLFDVQDGLSQETIQSLNSIHETTGEIRYLQPREYWGCDIFDEEMDQPI